MMHRNKTIKYGYLVLALALILETTSARAFEMKDQQREDRRLRIELETVPTPPQQNFDQYIQELAAAAQRDAKEPSSKREEDAAKAKQPKSFNPLVLFRW
jgi:hypothetical protein